MLDSYALCQCVIYMGQSFDSQITWTNTVGKLCLTRSPGCGWSWPDETTTPRTWTAPSRWCSPTRRRERPRESWWWSTNWKQSVPGTDWSCQMAIAPSPWKVKKFKSIIDMKFIYIIALTFCFSLLGEAHFYYILNKKFVCMLPKYNFRVFCKVYPLICAGNMNQNKHCLLTHRASLSTSKVMPPRVMTDLNSTSPGSILVILQIPF